MPGVDYTTPVPHRKVENGDAQIWTCDHCGDKFTWHSGSRWFGSLDGEQMFVICSLRCKEGCGLDGPDL